MSEGVGLALSFCTPSAAEKRAELKNLTLTAADVRVTSLLALRGAMIEPWHLLHNVAICLSKIQQPVCRTQSGG